MSRIQAIIFDLDDTLYPEREYAWSGFRAVAAAHQHELGEEPAETVAGLQRLFDSDRRSRVFDALLTERSGEIDRPLLDRMIQTYRMHPPAIVSYPDVDAALTRWRGKFKLGLITDGRSEAQWAKIDALNLPPRLDHIIVTSDLGEPRTSVRADAGDSSAAPFAKPHPRAFEDMASHLGVSHRQCVYVADNVGKDFVAPNALGWLTVRIARPGGVYGDAECAQAGQPAQTIHSLDELDPLL